MGVEVFNVPGEQRKTFTKEKMWTHFTYAWFRPISIQGRAQEAQIFALCIIEELPFPALYRSNLFRSHLTLGEETLQLPVCQGVNKTATLLWVCSTIAQQGKAWEKKSIPKFLLSESPSSRVNSHSCIWPNCRSLTLFFSPLHKINVIFALWVVF